MTEQSSQNPKEALTSATYRARRESAIWFHQRNKVRQEAAELIDDITTVLDKQLDPAGLPKVLEVKIGQEEYVSIRRIELRTLDATYPKGEDEEVFSNHSQVKVPSRFLPSDGHVGILVSPQIFGAEPTNQEEIDFLNNKTEYDDDDGWSNICMLQYFLAGEGEFLEENWNFANSQKSIVIIVKRGDKYLITETDFSIPARHRKSGEDIPGVRQIVPDENGDLNLPLQSCFWSNADVKAQEKVDNKYGMFYVAVSGSSEKETSPKPLKNLVPQKVNSTTT